MLIQCCLCLHSFNYVDVNNVIIPYLLLLIVCGILAATAKTKRTGEYWCVWEVEHGVNVVVVNKAH